jgi:hemerythrin superfamily protein
MASRQPRQIYDAIKNDHRTILQILERIEETSENAHKKRRELLDKFEAALLPHSRAEEKVLYDTLKDINETEDLALEAYEEHNAIEQLLRELKVIQTDDRRWMAKFEVLKGNTEQHIEEEEEEIFAEARALLAEDEAEMMTDAYLNLKKEVEDGSIIETALSKIAQYMPARFSQRFTDLSRRLT